MISFREIIKLFYIFRITIQHTVTKIRIHFRIKTIKPTIWKKKNKNRSPQKNLNSQIDNQIPKK